MTADLSLLPALPTCPWCESPGVEQSHEVEGRTFWVVLCGAPWQDPPRECPVMPCTQASRDRLIARANWSERAPAPNPHAVLESVERGARQLAAALDRIRHGDTRLDLAYSMGMAEGEARGAEAYKAFIVRAVSNDLADAPAQPAP